MVLLITLFFTSIVQSPSEIGWRDIVPLKSMRTQVERELGPLDLICQCYKTEHEIVHVKYATGPCTGDLPGWDVPRDTVLTMTIRPFRKIAWSAIEPNKEEFVKTRDDTLTSYYGNGNKGLRYSVSSAGFVESVSYFPSVKDNSYRCPGFPLTDGGITAYAPYDQFPYHSLDDITSRLGEFTVRLQKQPTYVGYIVVYAGRNQKTDEVTNFANRAREFLIKEFQTNPKTIVALNGGYREEAVVELFLIPSTWPPPVPTPTLNGIRTSTPIFEQYGQDDSAVRHGCARLDRTKAPQSITYETRFDASIRLRFKNNSSCTILVETDDHYPTQLRRLPKRGMTIEPVLTSEDGLRLPLHYHIQDIRRGKAPRPAYGWGDSVFTYEILPGQSIVFDVPAAYFKRRFSIAVPFAYAWEDRNSIASGTGGVTHRVYFLSQELPSTGVAKSDQH